MLKSLTINNYRCFNEHTINFRALTIAVGKNNAGKSTFIETIRLLSLVVERFKSLAYKEPPNWLELPKMYRGVSPSVEGIDMSTQNIFHRYGNPPACIIAEYNTGERVELHIGEDAKLYAGIFDSNGKAIASKSEARKLNLSEINILPQIGPLRNKEQLLTVDYVHKNMNSANSSLHFRNQLHYNRGLLDLFKDNIQKTWPNLRVQNLDLIGDFNERELDLFIQDNAFVAEIGWMGHGLQMWLQTIWFLTRCSDHSTVILDEPDVYMHADLQRKLIRYLKNRFSQVIVATHSIEIMSEVEPENILLIDKSKVKSTYSTSMPLVQKIVNSIGSIHNIQLARLWSSKKILIVEGKDIEMLKRIHNSLFGESLDSFESIPNFSIGGWGGWKYAVGSKMLLKNAGDKGLITYCLLDSDYHTEEEKAEKLSEAEANEICLHIWSKKELENYLLVPTAIERIINSTSRKRKTTVDEVLNKMLLIADGLKEEVTDSIASELQIKERKLTAGTAHKRAREIVNNGWVNKLNFVSGKEVVTRLSDWSREEFGVLLNANKIASLLRKEEINLELIQVMNKIANCTPF